MKKKLSIMLLLLMICEFGIAQKKTSGLLERSQIEEKYKWDTKDIYENEQAWEKDFKWIEQNLSQYDKYKSKLSDSARSLLDGMYLDKKINKKLGYLRLYAKLHKDVDIRDAKHQAMWSRYSSLETRVEVTRSFIKPEIILIPENKVRKFMDENSELKIYTHFFNTLASKKKHTLSKNIENLLAKVSGIIDNPYGVFGSLVYADLPFPVIKNDKGEDVQLNRSTSWRARASQSRDYRKRGYQEYYNALAKYKGTLTKNLNSFFDGKVLMANIRNYDNTLEASLARYNIPVKVYQNLIESVKNNLQPFHRWMKMKKKLLSLDNLHIYDTRVSIFSTIEKEYSWEEAMDLVLKSLALLGNDYTKVIKDAFEKRWVDVYPSPGKETGGYSSGTMGPHPYVKMNWGGKLFDFYTLVHELGHYVHATKTMGTQHFIYQDYPPFLAEVASTTAENLSQFYLIGSSEAKDEKLYHIEKYLDNVIMFLYNSTMMAEFELHMYQKVENGEPLSSDELSNFYGQMLSQYYGEDVTIAETDKHAWLEWAHYYLDYYLYSYATSMSAAIHIAENIQEEGKLAVQQFKRFLEAGNSDYPVEVLKKAGVDMTTPLPYDAVAAKMNALMDEMERMLKE
jgi:oligoendopeptidase F